MNLIGAVIRLMPLWYNKICEKEAFGVKAVDSFEQVKHVSCRSHC